MSNKDYYILFGVIGSLVTSIGTAIYSYKKGKEVEEIEAKIDRKISDVADNIDVDIPAEILERAIRQAAEVEARKGIQTTSAEIINEYKGQVRAEVRKSVEMAYENTKEDVKTELNRQLLNLDISGIKKQVIDEASDKVRVRLDSEVDRIATKFSTDLESASKIYKTISDKLGTSS